MRKVLLSFLLFLGFAAQSQNELDAWMASGAAACFSKESARKDLESFITPLVSSGLSEQKLLHKAFQKIHATYLKKYEPYTDFNEVFMSGRYDCLTATALFSHVLDRLHFNYEIIETNYHIFIMVKIPTGDVLLEMTDRWNGFVTGDDAILKRTSGYQENEITADNSKKASFQYSFKLYQSVSQTRLTGLLYFNQAVKAYNGRDLLASSASLEKSYNLYESPRCNELASLIVHTIMDSSTDEAIKVKCLSHLRNILVKKSSIVAAN